MNTTVATAIQRIGDLFATTLDFYFWMILFCEDEFKSQLAAVQFSILATPSAAVELRRSYDHTRRILDVHAYGVAMLSAMGRAQLHWNADYLTTDWEGVGPLSEEHVKEWVTSVRYIASNLRYAIPRN